MASAAAPALPPKTNDFFDTTALFATEKWSSLAKAGYVTIDVMEQLDAIPEGCEEQFKSARGNLSLIKLSRFPGEFLKSFNSCRGSVSELVKKPTASNAYQAVRDANGLVSPTWEGVQFSSKVFASSIKDAKWFNAFRGVSGVSLAFGMTCTSLDKLSIICSTELYNLKGEARQKALRKVTKAFIGLAKSVAYVALGVLTTLSVFFGYVFAPAIMTALSATTVVFTILDFYYKNWGAETKSE